MSRNPVQKFFKFWYVLVAEIIFFFQSIVFPMDPPGAVKHVRTKSDFDSLISSSGNKLVVIDFTASWCGPCQQIGPKFVKMAAEFEDCSFVKIDVDENKETAEACDVKAMPTFHFYKNGNLVDQMQGADANGLRSLIERNRKSFGKKR